MGYYGPRDFQHFTKDDREQQLQEEMMSDLPNTDLPVYLATGYFRAQEASSMRRCRLLCGLGAGGAARKGPGITGRAGHGARQRTKLPVGNIRDSVKLTVEQTQSVTADAVAPVAGAGAPRTTAIRRKNVQYNTASCCLRALSTEIRCAREPERTIGTFETDLVIPDLRKEN